MKPRARSALQDERVGALFSAIASAPQKREQPLPDMDWAGFYDRKSGSSGRSRRSSTFVGPMEARQLPGRGIGLVTSREVRAGELLLLEDAWATSATKGAASIVAIAELAEACVKKLGSAGEAERALFWCLHGTNQVGAVGEEGWQSPNLRLKIFEQYLHRLGQSGNEAGREDGPSLPAWPRQLQSAVSAIVASNSRRSEAWNSLTLLLDETQALGGLWFVASLFNHSCCANVTLSYSLWEDGITLVARAAVDLAQGEELVDTYVYPLETVDERRNRLHRTYGFLCMCKRCSVEAPLAAEAGKVADLLEAELQTFSSLRGRRAKPSEVGEVVRKIRQVLDRVFATAKQLPPSSQPLWRAQFVWGLHGLAMAAQDAGFFQEAVDAFQTCIELAALIAPSSEYELKYHMMLVQCMARRTLSSPPSALRNDTPTSMKEALRRAEEAHNRHYGGGGRHFLSRMQRRLEDFYAALRHCGKR
ncbi:SMYD3 [Symbiodinium necroappetens]|uniref:SMYD3 protein n=1 Tax=Symbiodinium necroappetens TaxID=1628268 RepID=A0A813ADX7_9DINO|nr:SMYD3 [Symbiodinium necroappetens]